MSNVVSATNTTAMVLGYWVLFLLLAGLVGYLYNRYDTWRYERSRQHQHDIEWDNLRSDWLFKQARTDTVEVPRIDSDQVNTDVLNLTVEQIYDYQEEYRNDVA